MQPSDVVDAAFSTIDDTDPTLLASLRAEIVSAWSEKSGVTALLRSVLQSIMIERPTSVVSYMINFFEQLQPRKIVIFGKPASGKRRIGEFLSYRLGLEYVSVRDLVEGASMTDTRFGMDLRKLSCSNSEPPYDLVERLVLARLHEKDCMDKGWVLEGWPMKPEHVQTLHELGLAPSIGVVLEVPDVVVEDRVSFRLFDTETGRLYHMTFDPPPLGVGARCVTRPGESTEEILARLQDYHAQLPDKLEALRKLPGFKEIRVDVDVAEDQLDSIGESIARKIDLEA